MIRTINTESGTLGRTGIDTTEHSDLAIENVHPTVKNNPLATRVCLIKRIISKEGQTFAQLNRLVHDAYCPASSMVS